MSPAEARSSLWHELSKTLCLTLTFVLSVAEFCEQLDSLVQRRALVYPLRTGEQLTLLIDLFAGESLGRYSAGDQALLSATFRRLLRICFEKLPKEVQAIAADVTGSSRTDAPEPVQKQALVARKSCVQITKITLRSAKHRNALQPSAALTAAPYSRDVLTIWDIPLTILAQQMCLIDHSMFAAIPISELMSMGWDRLKFEHKSDRIRTFIDRFNAVSLWVTSSIALVRAPLSACAELLPTGLPIASPCP